MLLQNLPIGLFQLHALGSNVLASNKPNLFFINLCTFSHQLMRAKGQCVQCDHNHRIYCIFKYAVERKAGLGLLLLLLKFPLP